MDWMTTTTNSNILWHIVMPIRRNGRNSDGATDGAGLSCRRCKAGDAVSPGRFDSAAWKSASTRAAGERRSSANTSAPFRPATTRRRSNHNGDSTPTTAVSSAMIANVGVRRQIEPFGSAFCRAATALAADRAAEPAHAKSPILANMLTRGSRLRTRLTAWYPPACRGTQPPLRPTPRPIFCPARRLRRSCRANSTICRSGSADSLRANPPTPPDDRAA